ncbi:hypothetical protein H257_08102 [Aphanomyces astaci]|uniref:Restriction endonuclease domain-containing protein n=1 Tax=Aphanomyces astaci TaxID=112090 RepID=W4GG00_APHAT|nr:hypothetical protein H257_08102 [Aphanomyces astaci]ETV78607.1 hypothetical protein H257_08102 [Aphanomyces astaci]|eukprot:XP_009832188.1 hypothetical protein H257_08102 [Aphanomyces astaci]
MLANERTTRRRLPRAEAIAAGASMRSSTSSAAAAPTTTQASPGRRKQVIHVADVVRARKELDAIWKATPANAPSIDQNGDASWGSVVLCEATTWNDFERWLKSNEGRVRRWVFEPLADRPPGKGRVVIYSIPSSILEETAGFVNSSIVMQIQEAGNDIRLFSTVRWKASPTCRTRDFGQEPDASLTPVGLTIGGSVLAAGPDFPYPNVIVEVAYKNDSLERLRAKLDRWMSDTTSVQVAIGIKIDAASPSRVAILLQRGQPVMPPVEFGHPDPGPLQISFPLASVYAGVALPPALAGLGNTPISIDLIQLRTVMDEAIGQELPAAQ